MKGVRNGKEARASSYPLGQVMNGSGKGKMPLETCGVDELPGKKYMISSLKKPANGEVGGRTRKISSELRQEWLDPYGGGELQKGGGREPWVKKLMVTKGNGRQPGEREKLRKNKARYAISLLKDQGSP